MLLDGVDLAKLRLSDLRAAIAIVPQDVQLFRGSILENIRYGRIDATDDEVRAAASDANVDEYVQSFPDGYATQVGERGVRLSGGERQRIAIARAVLARSAHPHPRRGHERPRQHSEAMVEQALDRLLPGRTTLIIAHRLSTVRRAHKVLFVEGGRVVEIGTHDELLAKGGAYAAPPRRAVLAEPLGARSCRKSTIRGRTADPSGAILLSRQAASSDGCPFN